MHAPLLVGAGRGVVVVVGAGVQVVVTGVGMLQAIPGGSQPPLQQMPPPIAPNGSGVEHVALLVGAGALVVVVVVVGVGVQVVVTGVGVLQAIPGGSHPPLQQMPPPIAPNGSGVVHAALLVGAGADVDVAGDGAEVVVGLAQAIPGGSQPPLQQIPPPMIANGSGVVHDAGGGVGAAPGGVVVGTEVCGVPIVAGISFERLLASPSAVYAWTAK